MSLDPKTPKTLVDADITVVRPTGRRAILGLMVAGGAVGAAVSLIPGEVMAQSGDGDTGAWHDGTGCPRGRGGVWTSLNDADNGNITDSGNRGRGVPSC